MGIEAFSRSHSFDFVDCNQIAIDTVKKNISSLGITQDQAKVLPLEDKSSLSLFNQR